MLNSEGEHADRQIEFERLLGLESRSEPGTPTLSLHKPDRWVADRIHSHHEPKRTRMESFMATTESETGDPVGRRISEILRDLRLRVLMMKWGASQLAVAATVTQTSRIRFLHVLRFGPVA